MGHPGDGLTGERFGDNAVAPGACIVAAPVAGEVAALTGADIEAATDLYRRASGIAAISRSGAGCSLHALAQGSLVSTARQNRECRAIHRRRPCGLEHAPAGRLRTSPFVRPRCLQSAGPRANGRVPAPEMMCPPPLCSFSTEGGAGLRLCVLPLRLEL